MNNVGKIKKTPSWVHAVGGTEYVVKVGNAAERQKLLEDLRMQLKELMLLSASLDGPMRDSPSDDEVTPVQKLTLAIERVLEHGLQGKVGERLTFWHWLENLERLLPSQAHVAVIRSLTCVNTERGKGRAWLRLALNEKSLSDCLQALIDDPVVMRKWHNESALLRHPEDSAFLISLLGGLSAIDFDLSLDEPWLDRESSMIRKSRSTRKKKGRRGVRRVAIVEEAGQHSLSEERRDGGAFTNPSVPANGSPETVSRNPGSRNGEKEQPTSVVQDPLPELNAMPWEVHQPSLSSLTERECTPESPDKNGAAERHEASANAQPEPKDTELLLLQEQLRLIEEKLQQNHRVRSLQQSASTRWGIPSLGIAPAQPQGTLIEPLEQVRVDEAAVPVNQPVFSAEEVSANEEESLRGEQHTTEPNELGSTASGYQVEGKSVLVAGDNSERGESVPVAGDNSEEWILLPRQRPEQEKRETERGKVLWPTLIEDGMESKEKEADTPLIRASAASLFASPFMATEGVIAGSAVTNLQPLGGKDEDLVLQPGNAIETAGANSTSVDLEDLDLELSTLDFEFDLSHLDTEDLRPQQARTERKPEKEVKVFIVPVDRRDLFSLSVGSLQPGVGARLVHF